MTYARQRLWLGITGVGTTVILCAATILFDLPHRFIHPLADTSFTTALAFVAFAWMIHAAVLFPIDVLGGAVVVRERTSVLAWLASWMRGVTVQWFWFALAAALLLRTAQQFGMLYATLVFMLLQAVLVSRQSAIAWLVGGLSPIDSSPDLQAAASAAGIAVHTVREVRVSDPSFVGAWTGTDAKHLWVPQRWVTSLSPEQLVVALARRTGVRALGLRRRGLLVAIAWNTLGFVLATAAPRADLVTAAGFVTTIAWFTLWSFVGVLILPSLSRPAVYAADRWARSSHDAEVVTATITQLDRWQDDEAERSPRVETIFHPVPSRQSRIRRLEGTIQPTDPVVVSPGAWHATRMMLYLSWAGVGLLARAVHCNVGRPAVWVMLPGD